MRRKLKILIKAMYYLGTCSFIMIIVFAMKAATVGLNSSKIEAVFTLFVMLLFAICNVVHFFIWQNQKNPRL